MLTTLAGCFLCSSTTLHRFCETVKSLFAQYTEPTTPHLRSSRTLHALRSASSNQSRCSAGGRRLLGGGRWSNCHYVVTIAPLRRCFSDCAIVHTQAPSTALLRRTSRPICAALSNPVILSQPPRDAPVRPHDGRGLSRGFCAVFPAIRNLTQIFG